MKRQTGGYKCELQLVYAFDFISGKWTLALVEARHDNLYNGELITAEVAGEKITSTAGHPFWVLEGVNLHQRTVPHELKLGEDEGNSLRGKWVCAGELEIDDLILDKLGHEHRITHISKTEVTNLPVSNLEIKHYHTYAVGFNEILVHNGGTCSSESVHPDLPIRNSYGPTHGTLDNKVKLQSGKNGGRAAEIFEDKLKYLSQDQLKAITHVEAHAAAEMVDKGLKEAVLHINYKNGPCQFCKQLIPSLLADGQKMWVVFPNGIGYSTNKGWEFCIMSNGNIYVEINNNVICKNPTVSSIIEIINNIYNNEDHEASHGVCIYSEGMKKWILFELAFRENNCPKWIVVYTCKKDDICMCLSDGEDNDYELWSYCGVESDIKKSCLLDNNLQLFAVVVEQFLNRTDPTTS